MPRASGAKSSRVAATKTSKEKRMGRGDLAKVRASHDRGRKKKDREKRQATERAAARKEAKKKR